MYSFIRFIENLQPLIPFFSQEDPIDPKNFSRFKNKESYIRSKIKGSKKTEDIAERFALAPVNSSMLSKENVLNIWNNVIKFKDFNLCFVQTITEIPVYKNYYRYRLLAFYQENNEMVNKSNVEDLLPIAGLSYIRGYITHVAVEKSFRKMNIYAEMMKFARIYLGIHGIEPGDDLTSRSFRKAQASYDYERYKKEYK